MHEVKRLSATATTTTHPHGSSQFHTHARFRGSMKSQQYGLPHSRPYGSVVGVAAALQPAFDAAHADEYRDVISERGKAADFANAAAANASQAAEKHALSGDVSSQAAASAI